MCCNEPGKCQPYAQVWMSILDITRVCMNILLTISKHQGQLVRYCIFDSKQVAAHYAKIDTADYHRCHPYYGVTYRSKSMIRPNTVKYDTHVSLCRQSSSVKLYRRTVTYIYLSCRNRAPHITGSGISSTVGVRVSILGRICCQQEYVKGVEADHRGCVLRRLWRRSPPRSK